MRGVVLQNGHPQALKSFLPEHGPNSSQRAGTEFWADLKALQLRRSTAEQEDRA